MKARLISTIGDPLCQSGLPLQIRLFFEADYKRPYFYS